MKAIDQHHLATLLHWRLPRLIYSPPSIASQQLPTLRLNDHQIGQLLRPSQPHHPFSVRGSKPPRQQPSSKNPSTLSLPGPIGPQEQIRVHRRLNSRLQQRHRLRLPDYTPPRLRDIHHVKTPSQTAHLRLCKSSVEPLQEPECRQSPPTSQHP